jgi:hypothetical protein
METKHGCLHTVVGVEIIMLQKMLKLVSLWLETQANNTRLHVRECCRQHGRRNCSTFRNGANRGHRHIIA